MQSLMISITEEQHRMLRQIYADTQQPLTETVRKALDFYFESLKKKEIKK